MSRYATLFLTLLALGLAASANAQSDPSNFDTVINVPGDQVPSQIGSNTQLNLSEGGELPEGFEAGLFGGSSTNIEVNITGGSVGDYLLAAGDSVINVQGGTLGRGLRLLKGGTVHFAGGTIGDSALVESNGNFNMTGGVIGEGLEINAGGYARIEAGTVGRRLRALLGSDVQLLGGEFQLNGMPYFGTTISLSGTDVFTGALTDGSAVIFSPLSNDVLQNVQLISSAIPALDTTPIVINASSPARPSGLRPGQTLTLIETGTLSDFFNAVDATLNIEGGHAGTGLELAGSELNMHGGTAGAIYAHKGSEITITNGSTSGALQAYQGSRFAIHGGTHTGAGLNAHPESIVEIAGGSVANPIRAYDGSELHIKGGSSRIDVLYAGSVTHISGGTTSMNIIETGTSILQTGGEIAWGINGRNAAVTIKGGTIGRNAVLGNLSEIVGGEFKLNGVPYTDPTVRLDGSVAPKGVFTGTLEDGAVFSFNTLAGDRLEYVKLTQAVLPAIETAPIVVDSPESPAPNGLRAGQTLTLRSEGRLQSNFAAVDAVLNLQGGQYGRNLEVSSSEVNISGGHLGEGGIIYASVGSVINLAGGTVTDRIALTSGSTLNMTGGELAGLGLDEQCVANLYGGTITSLPVVGRGTLNLYGSTFLIQGEPIGDLALGDRRTIVVDETTNLTGYLADGWPIDLTFKVGGRDFFNGTLTVTLILPGDYNGDAVVDLADYTVWRDNLGATASLPGDLTPGTVTQADYDVWKSHFGQVFPPSSLAGTTRVPEPSAWLLLLAAAALACLPHSHSPHGNARIAAPRP